MQIRLVLFGQYARYLPEGGEGGAVLLDAPLDATVTSLLDSIRLPSSARQYITVNGERVMEGEHLADGDEVRVIVPLGGG